ncbi:D-nopaline dehydrogenase [Gluconacetobacter liquefaciens]|uniref:FAD-binding oxidoreductase n=1 Tax=Gluconacetobacter liquefaciens TaxID=89584 RepID=A0A370FZB0_GLULI|nr:FAD-dependent oxidoreductase [Gluconacetobacter liquefaciens]MBB2187283.1 FAD-binding oxidoreductase [Gluconacetobacter liquefaciens]RDI36828.1 glycine/D-amino acid oxidase-like deaminating enzyme [Gluconacetobacter liquefaciens]GBQ93870.1 FAD dependent oxidoreductase [Gluconacetobacter liquefaciens NRIC 0522]GEB38847.1 D-nopaline dehydrogenase [Gluconacetobacter liquefaciens]
MVVDCVVIGGGIVGSAIAYGLAGCLDDVLLLDGSDGDPRAAQANFGLVWYQSKGVGMPAYQRLSRESVQEWRSFHKEIEDMSGVPVEFVGRGGLAYCLGDEEFEARQAILSRLASQMADTGIEMLSRGAVERLHPGIRLGPEVTGAAFSTLDAHVNPLRLLLALQRAFAHRGGTIRRSESVQAIETGRGQFRIRLKTGDVDAARVVIACGEASRVLAEPLGMTLPFTLQRGQIIVTERMAPFLAYPSDRIRQTACGTVMIGATKEDVGFDPGTTAAAAAGLTARAIRVFPDLAQVSLVRQWSGRRVITPDIAPLYERSAAFPGAYACVCHSGVTLAAYHARTLAQRIAGRGSWHEMEKFSARRFDVQAA